MSVIAVDIDSTLYDFEPAFRQAYLDLALESGDKTLFRGAYASWVEWRSPWDVCGSEAFQGALDKVHSPEVILQQIAFPGAREALQDIVDEGHEVFYISNRPEHLYGCTHAWIRSMGFPVGTSEDVICTMEDKQPYLDRAQYIIDDRPKTLVEFVYDWQWQRNYIRNPRKGFGLMYEHNRALTDVPGVFLAPTWPGLRFYLEREGVLSGRREYTNSHSPAI